MISSSKKRTASLGIEPQSQNEHTATTTTQLVNLYTIKKNELEVILQSWGYPRYRADQVLTWVRQGATHVQDMVNIPKKLRQDLESHAHFGALTLDTEQVSKDGTRKRAYRLWDGQLIESVLMPYDDGRYTACISSQAGCAMGCVFCATGQMGLSRQLSSDEIFEQVARFASELAREEQRLSNVVFMGMGEPLANFANVREAVDRIIHDVGIGARKITISTVGVVPNIRKLYLDSTIPQIRLAVSLHCATDDERSALLPANRRFGGLEALMTTLKEYIDTTGRRITLEWALIEHQNDTPETARSLGRLIQQYGLRRDMIHVNVIPLNPTGGFAGSPSGRQRVQEFVRVLDQDFGIACTPRVRRGIDIDAGCGQLKATVEKKRAQEALLTDPIDDDDDDDCDDDTSRTRRATTNSIVADQATKDENRQSDGLDLHDASIDRSVVDFSIDAAAVDFESDDYEDPEFEEDWEKDEALRLLALVQGTVIAIPKDLK